MDIPTVPYTDNRQAARAILNHILGLTPPVRHLRLQPLDALRPSATLWWLTPVAGWTTHAHSRLFLRRTPGMGQARQPDLMSAGFCLDRGLGRQLGGPQLGNPDTPDLVEPNLTMQPSWFWYRFRNDVLGKVLDAPMRTVLTRSDLPLEVELALHYAAAAPRPDYRGTPPADRLAYAILDERLVLHPTVLGRDELAPLNEAATMQDLMMRIEGVENLAWYWISVFIGIRIAYGAPDAGAGWQARDLWQRALDPWLPWLH